MEYNDISQIIKADPRRSSFQINPKLLKNLPLKLTKDSKNQEYILKMIKKGHEKILLRYTPIKTNQMNNATEAPQLQKTKSFDKNLQLLRKGFLHLNLCGLEKQREAEEINQ